MTGERLKADQPAGVRHGATIELAAILGSVAAVGMTLGITTPLFSVLLDRMGLDAAVVGLNSSVGVGATLLTAPLAPWLLRRAGPVPVMLSGIALSAIGIFVAGCVRSAWLWFVLRFIIGIGLSLHWVISETWLNEATTDANRGLVTGLYSALLGIGFALGPLIVRWAGVDGLAPFAIGAGLVLLAGTPLLRLRGRVPAAGHSYSGGAVAVLTAAPVIMLASVCSGFVDSASLALLPIYGLRLHMSGSAAIQLLAVATLGAVVMQLPVGWIGDRLGRRGTLIGCALVGAASAAALPVSLGVPGLLWGVVFVWGGAVVSFYTLALALLGDTFRGPSLAKANSALVITYCLGSIAGPPATGAAMDWMGPQGFVAVMIAVSCVLAGSALSRLRAPRF